MKGQTYEVSDRGADFTTHDIIISSKTMARAKRVTINNFTLKIYYNLNTKAIKIVL